MYFLEECFLVRDSFIDGVRPLVLNQRKARHLMKYRSVKIYGNAAALTITGQVNESGSSHTIGIEAARKFAGEKTYDWNSKTIIQVTDRELPVVLATLLGYQDQCEFRFHGKDNNKSYSVYSQNKGVLISLSSAANGTIRVPVDQTDLFSLNAIAMVQLQRNHGGLSSDVLLDLLERSFTSRPVIRPSSV